MVSSLTPSISNLEQDSSLLVIRVLVLNLETEI